MQNNVYFVKKQQSLVADSRTIIEITHNQQNSKLYEEITSIYIFLFFKTSKSQGYYHHYHFLLYCTLRVHFLDEHDEKRLSK